MNKPSLDELLHKLDSRYTLVVAAAKRARQIIENGETEKMSPSTKAVSLALKEIVTDQVKYRRTKSGIK